MNEQDGQSINPLFCAMEPEGLGAGIALCSFQHAEGIVTEHCYNCSWYFFLVFNKYHIKGM